MKEVKNSSVSEKEQSLINRIRTILDDGTIPWEEFTDTVGLYDSGIRKVLYWDGIVWMFHRYEESQNIDQDKLAADLFRLLGLNEVHEMYVLYSTYYDDKQAVTCENGTPVKVAGSEVVKLSGDEALRVEK